MRAHEDHHINFASRRGTNVFVLLAASLRGDFESLLLWSTVVTLAQYAAIVRRADPTAR